MILARISKLWSLGISGTRRRVMIAAGLVAIIILVGGMWYGFGATGDGDAAAQTYTVRRGPLTISVVESGTINPLEQIVIKSEVEGRTTILTLITEGTRVKEGQLLIELDSSNLEDKKINQQISVQNAEAAHIRVRENLEVEKNQAQSNVDKADLDYRFAQQDLTKYVEGEYPQELRKAEVEITIATEELERKSDKLDWSVKLSKRGFITRTELLADELAAKKAELDLELAQGRLDLLKKYTHPQKLEELTSDIEQTRMALARAKRKASADVVQAEADLRAKESEFRRQQSKLQKIVEQIEKCRITAPRDGMVVYATTGRSSWRSDAEPLAEGTQVRERQKLISLPTTEGMKVEVKVPESSLQKVKVGQPVRATLDALPGKAYSGRVVKIAPLPDAQAWFMNPDLKVYRTEIHLTGDATGMRTGMNCKAEIIVAEYADVLYVPIQCVFRIAGKPSVHVVDDDGVHPRQVEIGMDNNRMVHIIAGLEDGEKVLLTPPLGSSEAVATVVPPVAQPSRGAADKAPSTTKPTSSTKPAEAAGDVSIDIDKMRKMSPQERAKWFRGLSPQQRKKLREKFVGQGGTGRQGPDRRRRSHQGGAER